MLCYTELFCVHRLSKSNSLSRKNASYPIRLQTLVLLGGALARAPPVHAVVANNSFAAHFGRRLVGRAQDKLAACVALFAFAIANGVVALAVGDALRGGGALEIRLA
jgi:hypothetical protein